MGDRSQPQRNKRISKAKKMVMRPEFRPQRQASKDDYHRKPKHGRWEEENCYA